MQSKKVFIFTVRWCLLIFLITSYQHSAYSSTQSIRPLQLHYQSSQCQILRPGITLIETKQQWQRFANKTPNSFGKQPSEPLLGTQQLLIISAGQQANSEYKLRLSDLHGKILNGEITLPVSLAKPSGIAHAVISTPCMMLLLDTQGIQKVRAANMTSSIR